MYNFKIVSLNVLHLFAVIAKLVGFAGLDRHSNDDLSQD